MTGSYLILFIAFLLSGVSDNGTTIILPSRQDCLSCHENLTKNDVVHPELATTCDICHTPNGSEHPKAGTMGFSLSEKLPVLCYNCHTEFQESAEKFPVVHGPVNTERSCLNCHNPHSSPSKKLVLDASNELCLKCHNKTIVTDSSRISNIGQTLARAKSVHSPVESGGCVTCHNPHYSEKRALLIGNHPTDQYVKGVTDNYELCFMCHDTDLLDAKTTEFGTGFRNDTVNLHFVHVNAEKGRNCSMCHDVHGAANAKLIRDRLPFGSWSMRIDFSADENGGTCLTACHTEKKYNRTIPKN